MTRTNVCTWLYHLYVIVPIKPISQCCVQCTFSNALLLFLQPMYVALELPVETSNCATPLYNIIVNQSFLFLDKLNKNMYL